VKSDRNKHLFLLDCPELVIVDEAHGSAVASERNVSQHQRYELVRELVARPDRHLVLLTATPHSGVDAAFRSLLGFLDREFSGWKTSDLEEPQRIKLARNFVQRTRKDIEKDWEAEQCFPKREPSDKHYQLSRSYRELFEKTYSFCTEMVRTGQTLEKRRQRVRYWAALALLRCVMSSPAAAFAALVRRGEGLPDTEDEVEFRQYVFESANEQTDDAPPIPPVQSAERTLPDSDRRKLRQLARLATSLAHTPHDTKLAGCARLVAELLHEGFHPIVWCRYIATADYVAEGLQRALASKFPKVRAVSITGRLGDDERRAKVDDLAQEECRVLVATDCLSEGINLQSAFTAALHYDLPWNPNRLEQREGRVDRYGQTSPTVKTVRYFSPASPSDGLPTSRGRTS
jgi:superfamily II DNA or RNA helicase